MVSKVVVTLVEGIILGNFNCNSTQPPSVNIVKNFLNNKNLHNPNSNNSAVTANACNPGNISIQNSKCVGTFQLTSVNSKGKKINNFSLMAKFHHQLRYTLL